MMGKRVFNHHIVMGRQFGEQPEFLKQMADAGTAHINPLLHTEGGRGCIVEQQFAGIILAITDKITAEGALASATMGFHQISLALFQGHILVSHIGFQVSTTGEDIRNDAF